MAVIYAREFFELQLSFADTVARLSGLSLARTLFEYTNLYIRFGLGRDFDPEHPIWREYVAGRETASDALEWTYRFYVTRRPEAATTPPVVATRGCFSYAQLGEDRIRLHFGNTETAEHSPLGIERRSVRQAELSELFVHLKGRVRRPPRVVGASWLYNIEGYRRLFPKPYLDTARVLHDRFQHMPLWGQFVNRHGEVKNILADRFRERLAGLSSLEGLDRCFPFQVLRLEESASEFYEFYGV